MPNFKNLLGVFHLVGKMLPKLLCLGVLDQLELEVHDICLHKEPTHSVKLEEHVGTLSMEPTCHHCIQHLYILVSILLIRGFEILLGVFHLVGKMLPKLL